MVIIDSYGWISAGSDVLRATSLLGSSDEEQSWDDRVEGERLDLWISVDSRERRLLGSDVWTVTAARGSMKVVCCAILLMNCLC